MLSGDIVSKAVCGILLREVSVIVSTYTKDRFRYVVSCIGSLMKQSLSPKEIILVLDPDQDLMRFYRSCIPSDVKIVASEARGLSNARNTGVKNVDGEVVAFIDDDAFADEDWLRNLMVNYDDQHVVGVGGFIKPMWKGKRSLWIPRELDWIVGCSYRGLPVNRAFVRNPIGCNMSFRRNIFEKVGFFRADIGRFGRKLVTGEESEFSLRILKTIPGSKIIYDPSAVVYHTVPKNRANLGYVLKRSLYEGLSKATITSCYRNFSGVLVRENSYLKYMLNVALPSRFKRLYRFENICHLFALFASMTMVLIGFSLGKLQNVGVQGSARARFGRTKINARA